MVPLLVGVPLKVVLGTFPVFPLALYRDRKYSRTKSALTFSVSDASHGSTPLRPHEVLRGRGSPPVPSGGPPPSGSSLTLSRPVLLVWGMDSLPIGSSTTTQHPTPYVPAPVDIDLSRPRFSVGRNTRCP